MRKEEMKKRGNAECADQHGSIREMAHLAWKGSHLSAAYACRIDAGFSPGDSLQRGQLLPG